ncbi:MAG: tRNA pseudouridine(55) synthase TruB [Clostridia bacterium]|nr:tRNA pseudouridine(55) synthase TruB [Clostridia bacterium]
MKPKNSIRGGVIAIDKPQGFTSQDAVNKIRRYFDTKQVGHTGTLDPMATGVLLVLVGRAVKASEFLTATEKTYLAKIKLGITTDTEDTSGNILTRSDNIPTREKILSVLPSFTGDIMQTPPMYSALKVGGKKLVDLARSGIEVDRAAREINVSSLELLDGEGDEYTLKITCSKGTYIRTLCKDIGDALSCGGAMSYLRRVSNGSFDISECYTFEKLEEMTLKERFDALIPVERFFEDSKIVMLPPFYERLAKNGAHIFIDKIGFSSCENETVRMYGEDGFFAIGKTGLYPEGLAVKPIKFL